MSASGQTHFPGPQAYFIVFLNDAEESENQMNHFRSALRLSDDGASPDDLANMIRQIIAKSRAESRVATCNSALRLLAYRLAVVAGVADADLVKLGMLRARCAAHADAVEAARVTVENPIVSADSEQYYTYTEDNRRIRLAKGSTAMETAPRSVCPELEPGRGAIC